MYKEKPIFPISSVRFRWYQGHFGSSSPISNNPSQPSSTSASEWAVDNVFIGMQCQGHCQGHGVCVSGLFCQCDEGYGGETCGVEETRATFLLDDFEGKGPKEFESSSCFRMKT